MVTQLFAIFFIYFLELYGILSLVCFLLPGPTYRLVKSEVMQPTATQINCHLLSVNGGVKNGEGPIVSSHQYAEHYSIKIRTPIDFDQYPLYLYPLMCEVLSSTRYTPSVPVVVTRPPAWDQSTPFNSSNKP